MTMKGFLHCNRKKHICNNKLQIDICHICQHVQVQRLVMSEPFENKEVVITFNISFLLKLFNQSNVYRRMTTTSLNIIL